MTFPAFSYACNQWMTWMVVVWWWLDRDRKVVRPNPMFLLYDRPAFTPVSMVAVGSIILLTGTHAPPLPVLAICRFSARRSYTFSYHLPSPPTTSPAPDDRRENTLPDGRPPPHLYPLPSGAYDPSFPVAHSQRHPFPSRRRQATGEHYMPCLPGFAPSPANVLPRHPTRRAAAGRSVLV